LDRIAAFHANSGGTRMYDDDLTNLEDWIRRLKIEYHIFFSGNRKKPPDDLKMRVERLIKNLSESSNLTNAQRFRFTTLITRFYVCRDLWRRTMQAKEMGLDREKPPIKAEPSRPSAKLPAEKIRVSISNPRTEVEKVHQLYDALLRIAQTESRGAPMPYPQFAKYITTQTDGIRQKYGCVAVAFTIALEEGALRFTAAAESR
jgi:hypothetical protein